MFKIWIKLALMLVLVKICILEKTPHDSWWENNTCFLLLPNFGCQKHQQPLSLVWQKTMKNGYPKCKEFQRDWVYLMLFIWLVVSTYPSRKYDESSVGILPNMMGKS